MSKKFYIKNLYVFIPARKNSKRIKNKNLFAIRKKPMIVHTLEFAKKYFSIKNIIISSDNEKILSLASSMGFKNLIKRPRVYSKSNSTIYQAIKHATSVLKNKRDIKYLVLLQPTSPFRSRQTLKKALKIFFKKKKNVITTASRFSKKYNRVKSNQYLKDKINFINGNLYIINLRKYLKYKSIIKPDFETLDTSSKINENIDINWYSDIKKLRLAKLI